MLLKHTRQYPKTVCVWGEGVGGGEGMIKRININDFVILTANSCVSNMGLSERFKLN